MCSENDKKGVYKYIYIYIYIYIFIPFDINYLLKVPPDILSKYFNNLMAHLHI